MQNCKEVRCLTCCQDQTRPSYNTKQKHTINEFRAPARVTHRVVQAHSSKQALA